MVVLASLPLGGCGDPAPSTKLAPDVPTPDAGKFSQADIDKSKAAERLQGPDRTLPSDAR